MLGLALLAAIITIIVSFLTSKLAAKIGKTLINSRKSNDIL